MFYHCHSQVLSPPNSHRLWFAWLHLPALGITLMACGEHASMLLLCPAPATETLGLPAAGQEFSGHNLPSNRRALTLVCPKSQCALVSSQPLPLVNLQSRRTEMTHTYSGYMTDKLMACPLFFSLCQPLSSLILLQSQR